MREQDREECEREMQTDREIWREKEIMGVELGLVGLGLVYKNQRV
jgi:hypothetical protein